MPMIAGMAFKKYLFIPWIGIITYTVFSMTSGAGGFSAYRQMEAEKARVSANVEALKRINKNLENTRNDLISDIGTISVYAREQGFASKGERLARIVGTGIPQRTAKTPGQIVMPVSPIFTPDRTIKIFAICTAATVLICMIFYDVLRRFKDGSDSPT